MSSDNKPAKKKWKKPVGIFLIILAYALLATGIALACLSQLPKVVRIIAPFFGTALFSLSGAWGFVLCNRAELVYPLCEHAWAEQTHGSRVLYIITFPCRLFVPIFENLNGF